MLAIIPVAGFLATGVTYVTGERAVAGALQIVQNSDSLANTSRDFKSAVMRMRLTVKDFNADPSENAVVAFKAAQGVALHSLEAISDAIDPRYNKNIGDLRTDLDQVQDDFDLLVTEQHLLGFGEDSGARKKLRDTGAAVERIINENMTWLAEGDAHTLMIDLLTMRHYEAQYRINQFEMTQHLFFAAYKHFTDAFANVDGTAQMKSSLEKQVKAYADTFKDWIARDDHVRPLRAEIDIDSQRMMPHADDIINRARQTAEAAA
ncbi:MAG TPA: hypothetical protein VG270_04695, partial [Pseudolabrys sp.]|nr:hypothetical protein [Pseudolabrys sp.]